jgi:lipopolysaccharide transport system ATP-binding protein
MTKREIDEKLDEIIDFSGVEFFLDTPVKRYSSGMRVRLAFSVAAHLDPEILLIDEVLAVGDYSFQKKCLGKMDEVSKTGKTVLFVSHQLSMIRTLCNKSILLDKGKIIAEGLVEDIIKKYVTSFGDYHFDLSLKDEIIKKTKTDESFKVIDFDILQNQLNHTIFINSEPLTIKIHYKVLSDMVNFRLMVDLLDTYKDLIFRSFHDDMNEKPTKISKGEYISKVEIPHYFLAPKVYNIVINATIHNDRMLIKNGMTLPLKIEQSGIYNKAYPGDPIRGIIAPALSWETMKL